MQVKKEFRNSLGVTKYWNCPKTPIDPRRPVGGKGEGLMSPSLTATSEVYVLRFGNV